MDLVTYATTTRTRPVDFQRKLAEEHDLKVDDETVRLWFRGRRQPKAKLNVMEAIEAATEGKVTRHDMRPDVFGVRPSSAPQQDAAA